MNSLAEKYCCTKCDDYPVLILTVNFSDSKSDFQNDFISSLGVTTVCIPKEDGGSVFNQKLPNQNSAGSSYGGTYFLIKPDKSFIGDAGATPMKFASEQDMINEGIQPHTCSTPIISVNQAMPNMEDAGFAIKNFTNNDLTLSLSHGGDYSLSIFSVDGKLQNTFNRNLLSGTHHFNLGQKGLANGLYLIKINNGHKVFRKKVALHD